MAVCVINISGLDFHVEKFLSKSPFKPRQFYKNGDIPPLSNPQNLPRPDSGFVLLIGEDSMETLDGQVTAATKFLGTYGGELKRAKKLGADDFRMNFAVTRQEVFEQSNFLPHQLLLLAGLLDVGIELSVFQVPNN